MELRERLAAATDRDHPEAARITFAELKDRIHLAVISDLGPRLYNESLTTTPLQSVVLADIRNRLARSAGLRSPTAIGWFRRSPTTRSGTGRSSRCSRTTPSTKSWSTARPTSGSSARGKLHKTPVRFNDEHHLRRIINKIVAQVGRRVDESSPMVDARLPDGSRVNAVLPPLSLTGPLLTIRKFSKTRWDLEGLVAIGSLTPAGQGVPRRVPSTPSSTSSSPAVPAPARRRC